MMSVGKGQKAKSRSLRHLAETELGLSIQAGEHSPVDDARSTLYLYHKHRKVCVLAAHAFVQLACVCNALARGAVSSACSRLLTNCVCDDVFYCVLPLGVQTAASKSSLISQQTLHSTMKTIERQHAASAAHYIFFAAVDLQEHIDLCISLR